FQLGFLALLSGCADPASTTVSHPRVRDAGDDTCAVAPHPAVLFATWQGGNPGEGIDFDYVNSPEKQGYVVDYLDSRADLVWDKSQTYNVLVLPAFAPENTGTPRSSTADFSGPLLSDLLALLGQYLATGGGIVLHLEPLGNDAYYTASNDALAPWGAR